MKKILFSFGAVVASAALLLSVSLTPSKHPAKASPETYPIAGSVPNQTAMSNSLLTASPYTFSDVNKYGVIYRSLSGNFQPSYGGTASASLMTDRLAFLIYGREQLGGQTQTKYKTNPTQWFYDTEMDLIPKNPADRQAIGARTGYGIWNVKGSVKTSQDKLQAAITTLAPIFGGSTPFLTDLFKNHYTGMMPADSDDIATGGNFAVINDLGHQSIKDMFFYQQGKPVFFNTSYLSKFSGTFCTAYGACAAPGNTGSLNTSLAQTNPAYSFDYFGSHYKGYQMNVSKEPSITGMSISNNQLKFNVTFYGNAYIGGGLDVAVNFTRDMASPSSGLSPFGMDTLDGYWRRHTFRLYRDNADVSGFSRNYVADYHNKRFGPYNTILPNGKTVTISIPTSDVEAKLDKTVDPITGTTSITPGQTVGVYVTDNYGRWTFKEIPYAPTT